MQWKCTVCSYTPDGETPPGTCPVCGADESKYVQVDAEENEIEGQEEPEAREAPAAETQDAAPGEVEAKWRCTVCNYVHTGSEPPETCPVCGADRSLFERANGEEESPADAQPSSAPATDQPAASAGDRTWRCTVCGYIHAGPEPPETCPVCGADRSFFERVDGEEDSPSDPQPSSAPATDQPAASAGDRKWRCTVCGYVHTGPEPPEICSVCGADRSLFEEILEDAGPEPITIDPEPAAAAAETTAQRLYRQVTDLMVTQHAHPISVHIPNGVAPIGVLFLFLAVIFQSPGLEIASYCNLVVVLLAMPFVILSGLNDWKKRFGGNMTYVFRTKIICAAVISVLLLALVLWRAMVPDVAFTGGGFRVLYLALHVVMFGAAVLAGFMGGKLVFPAR